MSETLLRQRVTVERVDVDWSAKRLEVALIVNDQRVTLSLTGQQYDLNVRRVTNVLKQDS